MSGVYAGQELTPSEGKIGFSKVTVGALTEYHLSEQWGSGNESNKLVISRSSTGSDSLTHTITAEAGISFSSNKFTASAKAKVDNTERDNDSESSGTLSFVFNSLQSAGASAYRTISLKENNSVIMTSGNLTDYGDGYSAGYTAGSGSVTVTWPSAISRISSTPSETQSASFTANGTTKSYTIDIGDFTNAQGQTVNAARLTNDGSVVAALDINGLLTNMFVAGENNIKNAGGTEDIYSNGVYSLDKYVTTLTVDVPTTSRTSRGTFSCDVYSSYGSYTVTLTRTYSNSGSSDLAFFRGKDGSTVTVYT